MRDSVSSMKYWNHVTMRITTFSIVELLRLNGLEEFLLLGEWSIFACVPEDTATYEDLEWGLDLYTNDRLEGKPVLRLQRGTVVVSVGMPRPGIVEMLVPSSEDFVLSLFAGYRFPKDGGKRVVQRLPASQYTDDPEAMITVTVPMFRILPGAGAEAGLPVTTDRDPRSKVIGYLHAGTSVYLTIIVGTRAQLSRVVDGHRAVWGGWISILGVDAMPSVERILEETEAMQLAARFAAELKELEEQAALADAARQPELPAAESAGPLQLTAALQPAEEKARQRDPPVRSKMPLQRTEQRLTVTGGWRQVMDPVWGRPQYIEPLSGRITWGLNEVLGTGGLDDLLLARDWEICVVDPLAAEVMKDPTWTFEIFADPGLTGDPLLAKAKGDFLVVQVFEPRTAVATVLLPPSRECEETASGYARYRLRDGRPLLRALLPPIVDEYAAAAAAAGGAVEPEHDGAEPPAGPVLEGPYFAAPPGGAPDLPVSIGQDIGSDRWARLPRGYCVRTFADVLGLRARLPDLEGGGWVSVFGTDGTPHFRKQPEPPPFLELPTTGAEEEELEETKGFLPVVWPQYGVLWPPKDAVVLPPEKHTMPELLRRLGGGRAICDWHRAQMPPSDRYVYKSPLTFAQTTLDDLLRLRIWKVTVVEASELHLREYGDPRSTPLAILPFSSLVVAEWVSPGNAVRVLLPGTPDAEKPLHAWADLGGAAGTSLVPLVPGAEFWIEPKGGHLPEEEQCDPDLVNITKVAVRAEREFASASVGWLQRGDAVQLAEVDGRCARIVHTRCVLLKSTIAEGGGWLDICDEAGWSYLKARRPGEIHIEEIKKKALQEVPEAKAESRKPSKASRKSSRSASKRSTSRHPSKASSVHSVSMPGSIKLVAVEEEVADEEDGEEDKLMDVTSAGVAELPPLLSQLGVLEGQSISVHDWREHRDPVWGRRYFVNKWSGQIVHQLVNFGVSYPSVRLTLYFSNLSITALREEMGLGPAVDKRLADIASSLLAPLAALADVPEDTMEVHIAEGPDTQSEGAAEVPKSPNTSEDSIGGGSAGISASAADAEERKGFRAVARIRAPGTKAAWASAGLKVAMADAEKFTNHINVLICNVPHILSLRVDLHSGVDLVRADLEELEIPRTAPCLRPPPEPEPPPPPPIDDDIREMSRNMIFAKPKLLQMPNRTLGPPSGNAQALAEGLRKVPEPSLEEVGLWKCVLGDAGAVSLASVLSVGLGAKLHTLLLDENRIAAAGATALGAALRRCPLLRELGVARNPLGAGFPALASGLGSGLVVFDASDASLDDRGAAAAAVSVPRWPGLRSLRLAGNAAIGRLGLEALVRAAVGAQALRLADVKGCDRCAAAEWPRLSQMLKDAGRDPNLVRL